MSQRNRSYNFVHCDVFASRPYSGNSLAVFPDSTGLSAAQMLTMTQELRHFESIFLTETEGRIEARVFDLSEELPFAGHPIIGAACSLHMQCGAPGQKTWTFALQGGRTVRVTTMSRAGRYFGTLDQGQPDFLGTAPNNSRTAFAEAFNLSTGDLSPLPLEIISTGLKYLVVPVTGGLREARIMVPDLEDRLRTVGAEFAYLFNTETFEGRHWNNDGLLEDVATGSAAGVIGAYALKHGLAQADHTFTLTQGHYIGRPSALLVTPYGTPDAINHVTVAGEVAFVGTGEISAP